MPVMTEPGPDGRLRCRWCLATPEYVAYHDDEWGFPVADDQRLFEKLCLEGFQSGLSWRTILAKREGFRRAFHRFDIARMARMGERDVERLVQDEGIVRHRGKIEAVIHNAARARELIDSEGSLAAYFWNFGADLPEPPPGSKPVSTSALSEALSKDLKKRGWKFVGPTTVYAFLQAMGRVNDHAPDCITHAAVVRARKAFKRPKPKA
jgi:DNA-3-methyladenine glycosylase I